MKIICQKDLLVEAVSNVSRAVCAKSPIPVLARIQEADKLKAENEKLRAELDEKEKYYEQMIDALAATDSAELEQVKRTLAMMWFSYVNKDEEFPHSFELEALEKAESILGPWAEYMPKYLRREQE